ncbi:hypothetical protein ILUMI_21055, partial [Ignelater luminosus]
MKVKYASQVFGATVAAGLNCYISLGQLPNEATATATFVKLVDTLFDILNSWEFGASKFSNRPFMGSNYQIEFLKQMLNLFQELNSSRCHQQHEIYHRMANYHICCFKPVGRFKKNLFGNNRNPTPIQFVRGFKRLFAINYFMQAEGSNCIDDLDSVLVTINNEYMKRLDLVVTSPSSPPPAVHIDVVDYRHWDNVTEQNGFEYVTGYLARKCCERHSCDLRIGYIFGSG